MSTAHRGVVRCVAQVGGRYVTSCAQRPQDKRITIANALGVFTLVTRGWAASEFLMSASKFNMTPNGAF